MLAEEINVTEAHVVSSGGRPPQLIDVREGWERMMGAIEPSAHVPLSELERGAADLGTLIRVSRRLSIVRSACAVCAAQSFCGSGMDFAT